MKKKGWLIALIIFIILIVGAGISLVFSCVYGSFDLMIIDTMMSKPNVVLTHDDGNPQLELSHTFLKRADQEKYEVGILVFDSYTDDFKSGKQKLKYDEFIKNDNLLYAYPEDLSALKDNKISYILDDEFSCCEIDVYIFIIKDKTLYLSKRLTTSVDEEASMKLAKMEETNDDYSIYKKLSMYSLTRLVPNISLRKYEETGKYGLRFQIRVAKDLYDLCDEVGLLTNPGDVGVLISAGVYPGTITSLIEGKQIVKYAATDPGVVNKDGIEDEKGNYIQFATIFDNLDTEANADIKCTVYAYFVYKDCVFISKASTASLNDLKKLIK